MVTVSRKRVLEIAAARRAEALAAVVHETLRARGWNGADLARAIFGADEHGKPRQTGKISALLNGKARPKTKTLARFAEVLDVPLETLADPPLLQGSPTPMPAPVPRAPAAGLHVTVENPPPPVPRKAPDQFALVIDAEGRASLRVNLVDVPMRVAMQAMAALTGAGLLSGGQEGDGV